MAVPWQMPRREAGAVRSPLTYSKTDTASDACGRVAVMWRHILPSVAPPAAISRLRPEGATDPAAATARDEDRAEVGIEVGAVTG